MRTAYLIASNGPENFGSIRPLQYAERDVMRVMETFSSPLCGFNVEVATGDRPSWEIAHDFELVCERAAPDDALVCYFSGHGLLDSKGSLLLLLDHSSPENPITSCLNVRRLIAAMDDCKARNKLLILDCCHAGAVAHLAGLKGGGEVQLSDAVVPPDNFSVLMASGKLERARELSALEGSFFSAALCSALGSDFARADADKDGRISIEDLADWLEKKAVEHNQEFADDPVPYPSRVGRNRGDFHLTVEQTWSPVEIDWPDGTTMVLLPLRDVNYPDHVVCIGKHPVTNAQYQRFVKKSHHSEPVGERIREGEWWGPFAPWRAPKFMGPHKPVVCVSYHDADAYVRWVQTKCQSGFVTSLPSARVWEYAAFGTAYPDRNPETWMKQSSIIHHNAIAPVSIDSGQGRINKRGITDMIGNVWEWCARPGAPEMLGVSFNSALRGGGFYEDLAVSEPFIESAALRAGESTKHSDTGFRISGLVPEDALKRVRDGKLQVPVVRDDYLSGRERQTVPR